MPLPRNVFCVRLPNWTNVRRRAAGMRAFWKLFFDVQRQLANADIPGKPMPLAELATLMKSDQEKLVRVVQTAGEALQ